MRSALGIAITATPRDRLTSPRIQHKAVFTYNFRLVRGLFRLIPGSIPRPEPHRHGLTDTEIAPWRCHMHMVTKRLTRWLVQFISIFLPEEKGRTLERKRRGREEFRKLKAADYVFASYAKSGRTWVRVMLSRYYQIAHGIPEALMMGFDNFHKKNPDVPKIFFTHDNYLREYTGNVDNRKDFYEQKVVLLVRRPQDVAVSQFFQWKYRMRPHKIPLNRYPPQDADIDMLDFVMNEDVGLPRIVSFLNAWARELPKIKNLLVVRYEDLRANPEQELTRMLEFLGENPKPGQVTETVEFGSVENLRKLESQDYFWRSGSRLTPRDKADPNSYKVRRAKVGGYRDYFEDAQLEQIDAYVNANLSPVFDYGDSSITPTSGDGSKENAA